jgi:hypothetical protein
MKRFFAALTLVSSLLLPAAAFAQQGKPAPKRAAAPAAAPAKPKVKNIDFGKPDPIIGDLPTAEGTDVIVRENLVHTNLIRLRSNFYDRIVRSAESL